MKFRLLNAGFFDTGLAAIKRMIAAFKNYFSIFSHFFNLFSGLTGISPYKIPRSSE